MSKRVEELIKSADGVDDVRISNYRSLLAIAAAIDRLADMVWYTRHQQAPPKDVNKEEKK